MVTCCAVELSGYGICKLGTESTGSKRPLWLGSKCYETGRSYQVGCGTRDRFGVVYRMILRRKRMNEKEGKDLAVLDGEVVHVDTEMEQSHGRPDPLGRLIAGYIEQVRRTLDVLPIDTIMQVARLIESARMAEKKVFIFGNGGSAATATHFACDLSKGGIVEGKPRVNAISLCDNMSLLSAWANDTDYSLIFAEQLENHVVGKGDVVIGISGSGNSPNVLKAIDRAKTHGAVTIGFSGFNGGKLKDMVDVPIVADNFSMEQVEDVHMLLEHVITTCVRDECIIVEDDFVSQAMKILDMEMENN